VTEDKLCLFLEQKVVNRESRASGYQTRKAKRKEMWENSEPTRKRRRTAGSTDRREEREDNDDDEWNEENLDALFNETVRFSVINNYVSAVTELYAWQSERGKKILPPLRGAILSAMLNSVRRDEDGIRGVNFIDWGLFTIAGGYDAKELKKAIVWCWETASKMPGSVESYPPRKYKIFRGSNSVLRLWTEWTLGLTGGPSIEALDRCWGARWRVGSETMFYSRRRRLIKDIRRRTEDSTAKDERQAIDQLEQLRGRHSLDWLYKTV
jgi:hypothetical protein